MKIVTVKWENEDVLPDMTDDEYNQIYTESKVMGRVGVRIFPYVEVLGERFYLGTDMKGRQQ